MTPPIWLYWPAAAVGGTVVASGGTETDVGGYRYHTFTSGGTFTVTTGGQVDILVVGGGGGGGRGSNHGSGGGGAGAMLEHTTSLGSGTYDVVVGPGGAGSVASTNGGTGGSSSFIQNTGTVINLTATGGGGGATSSQNGLSGGSGSGGGGSSGFSGTGGTADSYTGDGTKYGNNGGAGLQGSGGNGRGGGGGGAGAAGSNASSGGGGNGGNGRQWLDGVTYAGGGGGSTGISTGVSGNGGTGGGGQGGSYDQSASSGQANTGGGGGGATNTGAGSGGSGIVIVRYPLSAVVLWTPNDLAIAPEYWFDANEISGLSNGDQVNIWNNRGSNVNASRDSTNSLSGYPKYLTNSLNSLPGVEWNERSLSRGTRMFAGALATRTSDLMVAAVWKTNTVENGACMIALSSGYFEMAVNRTAARANVGWWNGSFSATTASSPTITTSNVYLTTGVWDRTAETRTIWVNGTQQAQSTSLGSHTYSTATSMLLGNNQYTNTSVGQQFAGIMYEVVVLSSNSDPADREKVEGYLAHKWGLEGNLPVGHPYKTEPPVT